MMGSPESEVGRDDDEDYHQVTLSKGYWLADTACTQALWQAVMGDNPADFKESLQNPVETVSWLDIQAFLHKLNQHIPNLQEQLPSEAQWEYACRSGTKDAFNFKGEINLDKVNYSGVWDESGWADKSKQKTTSVKSYQPNQWGLYEMHGNVWEWCLDEWSENLGSSPVLDPVQSSNKADSDKGVPRVLRGGSWDSDGRSCRSAFRNWNTADYRFRHRGFRLSLGHERPHPNPSPTGEGAFKK